MRKSKKLLSILSLFAVCVSVMMCNIDAEAGSLNAAENAIISVLTQTYEVDGAYYRVKSEYVDKARTYMSQDDIDISEDEANSYIAQFYAALDSGAISQYVEKVGDVVKEEPAQEAPTPEKQPEDPAEGTTQEQEPAVEEGKTQTSTTQESQSQEVTEEVEPQETEREDSETEESATEVVEMESEPVKLEDVLQEASKNDIVEEQIIDETGEENKKDYSDAPTNVNNIGIEKMLIIICIVTVIIAVAVVCVHRWKRKR